MKKIDWVRKLTSRKFWMAIAGFVAGIAMICGAKPEELEKIISGAAMAIAAFASYSFAESRTDSAAAIGGVEHVEPEKKEEPGKEEAEEAKKEE